MFIAPFGGMAVENRSIGANANAYRISVISAPFERMAVENRSNRAKSEKSDKYWY